MSLQRRNEYGTVKINDNIFARIVLGGIARTGGKVFCASERTKILGGIDQKVSTGELVSNIKISEDEEKYLLQFYIIITFGASIKENCGIMLDYIEKEMKKLFPDKKGIIQVKIVGVKSRQIAARDIKIVREYEP